MKILTALLKYDYGNKDRGISIEKEIIFPAIVENNTDTIPFWLEEHGFPDSLDILQEDLYEVCFNVKPDYVFFILMNDEIYDSTLKKINLISKTINFFPDDQWRFENYSSKKALNLNAVITVDKYSVHKYKKIGINIVIHSQWGAYYFISKLCNNYKYEISFVGQKNSVREWYIEELSRRNINVNCFGYGWNSGKVTTSEMYEIFSSSKISLNLSNSIPVDYRYHNHLRKKTIASNKNKSQKSKIIHLLKYIKKIIKKGLYEDEFYENNLITKNVEQIKARNFEIPAAGGFQISQFTLEIEDYFENGKEIVLFSTIDELEKLILYYINNSVEREQIRVAGNIRSKEYSYVNIYKKILESIRT